MSAIESPHVQILCSMGLGIWKTVAICEDLGWTTPQGGLPYFHTNTPAIDLVRWTTGDREAGDRLQLCLPEWRPALPTMADILASGAR